MFTTAILTIPLGIGAAVYLEEFADPLAWYNRFIEVNIQNLAAVPSIVYGLLAVAALAVVGFTDTGVVIGGAVALGLLILPVIIITTREAVRAVPRDIRDGLSGAGCDGVADDLATDACRQPFPASRPARSWACRARSAKRRRCSSSASPGRCCSTPTAWSVR